MKYRQLRGYKYQLAESVSVDVPTLVNVVAETDFIILVNGRLLIKENYAWDGPSGPAIDTQTFMRGSLVHDALYQLMRGGWMNRHYRIDADMTLRTICLEDGMSKLRAWYVYHAVRIFSAGAVKPRIETFNQIIEI